MVSRCIRCVARLILMSRLIGEAVKASNSQRASSSFNKSVPFAADDRDRRLYQSRVIGEIAVPGVQNVGERTGWSLHSAGSRLRLSGSVSR